MGRVSPLRGRRVLSTHSSVQKPFLGRDGLGSNLGNSNACSPELFCLGTSDIWDRITTCWRLPARLVMSRSLVLYPSDFSSSESHCYDWQNVKRRPVSLSLIDLIAKIVRWYRCNAWDSHFTTLMPGTVRGTWGVMTMDYILRECALPYIG